MGKRHDYVYTTDLFKKSFHKISCQNQVEEVKKTYVTAVWFS